MTYCVEGLGEVYCLQVDNLQRFNHFIYVKPFPHVDCLQALRLPLQPPQMCMCKSQEMGTENWVLALINQTARTRIFSISTQKYSKTIKLLKWAGTKKQKA